jgi:DNA-binding transcriptional ArsR family regulator
MTPNAIAEHFDSSRQTISKHIQILTECQLLKQEQSGREIYYHLNPKNERSVRLVEQFRELWEAAEPNGKRSKKPKNKNDIKMKTTILKAVRPSQEWQSV